jgi:hypothetical protein
MQSSGTISNVKHSFGIIALFEKDAIFIKAAKFNAHKPKQMPTVHLYEYQRNKTVYKGAHYEIS